MLNRISAILILLAGLLILAGSSSACQDSATDAGEPVCPGVEFAGMTCQDFGYPSGFLQYNSTCTGYLVSDCRGMPSWAAEPPCTHCGPDEVCHDYQCVEAPPRGRFSTSQRQTFEIRTATLSGELKGAQIAGQANPESRDYLLFWNPDLEEHSSTDNRASEQHLRAQIGADGHYSVDLYAGASYRVYWISFGETHEPQTVLELTPSPLDVSGDRAVDFVVPQPVELSGTLSVTGSNLSASGELMLTRMHHADPAIESVYFYRDGLRTTLPIDTGDNRTFSTMVYPGDYEVRFVSSWGSDLSNYRFAEPISVHADTFRELEVPVRTLRGRIEVPALMKLASPLRLYGNGGHSKIELDDEGRFEQEVPMGTYTLRFKLETNDAGSYRSAHEYEVVVDDDTDFVMPSTQELARFTGTIDDLHNADLSEPLHIEFVEPGGGNKRWIEVQPEDGAFTMVLPPGEYNASLNCWSDRHKTIHLGEVSVEEGVHLDLEVPDFGDTIRLHGEITVRGEQVPDSLASQGTRGYLSFSCINPVECQDRPFLKLSITGPARYEVELLPGVPYRVELSVFGQGGHGAFQLSSLPLGTYVLQPELVVERAHRRDFDIKLVRVKTEITAYGEQLPVILQPDAHGEVSRGHVTTGGAPKSVELPLEGPAIYEDDLYPGYRGHRIEMIIGLDQALWQNHVLESTDETTHEISLPLRKTQVRLTHNGVPIDSDEEVGRIYYETPWGKTWAPVAGDGTADVWWFGEDPTITFDGRHNDVLPHGATLLQQ